MKMKRYIRGMRAVYPVLNELKMKISIIPRDCLLAMITATMQTHSIHMASTGCTMNTMQAIDQ
jgi:hypothetical protein